MKAEYEFTVKIKVVKEINSILECADLSETADETMFYVCDRLVEEGFITAFEFVEKKMEAK